VIRNREVREPDDDASRAGFSSRSSVKAPKFVSPPGGAQVERIGGMVFSFLYLVSPGSARRVGA
jgi:hypothetical protein